VKRATGFERARRLWEDLVVLQSHPGTFTDAQRDEFCVRRIAAELQENRGERVSFIRNLLLDLSALLPEPRVIYDREGGTPYLSRWYLIRPKPADDPVLKGQSVITDERAFDLFLHRFHRSDDDGASQSPGAGRCRSFSRAAMRERRFGDKVVTKIARR
jgi:hypothetical protein